MKHLTTQLDNLINLLIRFDNYLKINYVKQDISQAKHLLQEVMNETQANNRPTQPNSLSKVTQD